MRRPVLPSFSACRSPALCRVRPSPNLWLSRGLTHATPTALISPRRRNASSFRLLDTRHSQSRKQRRSARRLAQGRDGSDAGHARHLGGIAFRYRLGGNPYDPHDNIIAGSAYIRRSMIAMDRRAGSPPTMPVRSL